MRRIPAGGKCCRSCWRPRNSCDDPTCCAGALVSYQDHFNPNIYADLFEKYQPDLVIAGSPGFRLDRFLLREAAAHEVPSAASIISWDSSSSYGLPGAKIDMDHLLVANPKK